LKLTSSELAERIDNNAPELLKSLPQWVMWKYQQVAGKDKPKKPPYQPTGRAASVDDPRTWSSYRQAIAALDTGSYQGIGFMLQGGIVAIDLDYCLTEVAAFRRITKTARRVYVLANSYTEISPSGKGLHIFLRGHLPDVNGQPQDGMRYGNSEMYEAKRYITVTGERVGDATEIRADQEAINQIYALLKAPEPEREQPRPEERKSYSLTSGDAEVIRKAKAARNGSKFTSLYEGEITSYRSKSEAHLALIAMLIYWTNGDTGQVDRLFKSSDMYLLDEETRDKWDVKHRADGATYGQMTIEKASRSSRQM
jgi:putative DNA primase/helicase